jgi:hypothetical protein
MPWVLITVLHLQHMETPVAPEDMAEAVVVTVGNFFDLIN